MRKDTFMQDAWATFGVISLTAGFFGGIAPAALPHRIRFWAKIIFGVGALIVLSRLLPVQLMPMSLPLAIIASAGMIFIPKR